MSTVLWANLLIDGEVQCEEVDKYHLFDQFERLIELTEQNGLPSFENIVDFTDMKFNLEELELPDGIESTDEIMAKEGVWVGLEEAQDLLKKVVELLGSPDDSDLVSEINETLEFIQGNGAPGARFNFAAIM